MQPCLIIRDSIQMSHQRERERERERDFLNDSSLVAYENEKLNSS